MDKVPESVLGMLNLNIFVDMHLDKNNSLRVVLNMRRAASMTLMRVTRTMMQEKRTKWRTKTWRVSLSHST